MLISFTTAPELSTPFLYAADSAKQKLSILGCPLKKSNLK
jgi:hypothetical protein